MPRHDVYYRRRYKHPGGELPPASVTAPPVLDQCRAYVDSRYFGERCENHGTHWLRRDLLDRMPSGDLRHPEAQHFRWCPDHARAGYHEPVPEDS